MSSNRSTALLMRMMQHQALMEVLKEAVPQMFSSDKIMNPNADRKEQGDIDELKLANLSPELLEIYQYMSFRAEYYDVRLFKHEIDLMLRGSNAIGAFRAKQAVEIINAIAQGAGKGKSMQRKSWTARHITERGQPEFEEVPEEGA